MAFVVGPYSFYAVRLLLGAAEAGFFPGVILYPTYWFRRAYRGRIVAVFMAAIPISSFLDSPISAAILNTDGILGLRGWQWLFILEDVPAVLLSVAAIVLLPDGPGSARWLTPQQSAWLQERLASERGSLVQGGPAPARHLSLWQVMRNRYVLAASLIYAGASDASQCLSLRQPQIIKSFGLTNLETGSLNAIPFGIASVLMVLWGRSSDRSRGRVWHTALPLGLLAVTATYTVKGPFWALSSAWLLARAAAAGIAPINAIGNIGGFVGTYLLGVIKDAAGSYPLGLLPLVVLSALGFLLVVGLGQGRNPSREAVHARRRHPDHYY